MASLMAVFVLSSMLAAAHGQITSPVNGAPITVQYGLPEKSATTQPDDPSISGPNEVFTQHKYGSDPNTVGIDGTKPIVSTGLVGRKLLQDALPTGGGSLQLSGDGVKAGDSTAGVEGNAFGNGYTNVDPNNLDVKQQHIQPHGVNYAATADGSQYSGTVGANPDGLAGEGPVLQATGRK